MLSAIGTQPPSGSVVHALLITPLNSSRTKKGDLVDAVVSQPLVVSNHLFLPEGSHIKGFSPSVAAGPQVGPERAAPHRISRTGSSQWHSADGGSKPGERRRGAGRTLESRLRRRCASHYAENAISDHCDLGGISEFVDGRPRPRCGHPWSRRRRRRPGRSQRSFRISLFGHNHRSARALPSRLLGFRLLWRGYVGILPLPGPRARRELSQGHVDADRTGNS